MVVSVEHPGGTTFTICVNMCVQEFTEKGAFFRVRLRSEQGYLFRLIWVIRVHFLETLSTALSRQCRDNREFTTVDMPSLLCRQKTVVFMTLMNLIELEYPKKFSLK